jgi:hypothetical protein
MRIPVGDGTALFLTGGDLFSCKKVLKKQVLPRMIKNYQRL